MILYPNEYFNNVREINIDFLKKNEIKALILDVDNTLIDYDKNLDKATIKWAENLKKEGTKLYIEYEYFGKKPLKIGFKKVQEKLQEKPENIGVVGDQIFTDVIGGNRCKMFTILVDPIAEKDIWITLIKRPIENMIKEKYKKTKEGEYGKKTIYK